MASPAALRPIILCGPSGSGKSTLLEALLKGWPTRFANPVSDTTRAPRSNEVAGSAYHFIDKDNFHTNVEQGAYIEHVSVHGNFYGLSRAALEATDVDKQNLLIMDVHGCAQMRKLGYHPFIVWVGAPSTAELTRRLCARGTETIASIETRMETSATEETYFRLHPNEFDVVLVNDDLEDTLARLYTLIAAL